MKVEKVMKWLTRLVRGMKDFYFVGLKLEKLRIVVVNLNNYHSDFYGFSL